MGMGFPMGMGIPREWELVTKLGMGMGRNGFYANQRSKLIIFSTTIFLVSVL